MELIKLSLDNFRNIEREEIEFFPGINVLHGKNAQGKTSIIEAIWLLSCGKSFRTVRYQEMIEFNKKNSNVSLKFRDTVRENTHSVKLYCDKKKLFSVNEVQIKKTRDILGKLGTVLFIPEHLNIIKDGPSERRKFIDIAICQIKKMYLSLLTNYQHALEQRNTFLRAGIASNDDTDMLEIWDERIADLAAGIISIRINYMEKLNSYSDNVYKEISKNEKLKLEYKPFFNIQGQKEEDIKILMIEKLKSSRKRDLESGTTNVGPHKDEIDIFINGKSARQFASQGQQRSGALAMKMAEADIMKQECGEEPVLLLDDILSELDDVRKDYVLNRIKNRQVIITSCERKELIRFSGRYFSVERGKIVQENG